MKEKKWAVGGRKIKKMYYICPKETKIKKKTHIWKPTKR
jgi:hypothetical protein